MDPAPPLVQEREDDIDARLIQALQQDGRSSITRLARLLEVTRDTASSHLRRLLEHGDVRVVAALDPRFAGHRVLTHSMVALDGPAAPIAEAIAGLPEAVFVTLVSGTMPIVFESRNGNVEELHGTLDRIRRIPGVRGLRVTSYDEIVKGFFVSAGSREVAVDDLDYELIAILQRDGRTSYRGLGSAVRISPSAARARVARLIEAGVIRISVLKTGGIARGQLAVGIGITAIGDVSEVRRFLSSSGSISFAARTHGNYDYIATLVGASTTGILSEMEKLRAHPGVIAVESWTHYHIVKEDYARALGRVLHE